MAIVPLTNFQKTQTKKAKFNLPILHITPTTPVLGTKTITPAGGGSFNANFDTGKAVLTPRGYAGVPITANSERDHIIAVALGGTSTSNNIKIQQSEAADYKDKVENYYINQYKQGKVNLNEAVLKVLTWDSVDIPGQESYNKMILNKSKGFLERNLWEKIASIPIGKTILNWSDNYANQIAQQGKKGIVSNVKEAVSAGIQTPIQVVKQEQQSYQQYKTAIQTPGTPTSQKIATGLNFATAHINTALSPISAIFSAAEKIPALKAPADFLGGIINLAGKVGKIGMDKFVDVLPIDQKTKDILRPAFENVGSLIGQIVLGGSILKVITKGKPITKDTIDTAVAEAKIKEKVVNTEKPATEGVAKVSPLPQKGAPGAITTEKGIISKPVAQEVKPTEITGGKVSGIAKSVEAKSIEQGLTNKGFDKLAEYTPVKIKEQSQVMSDLMKKDIEQAKRIAVGKEEPPQGLKTTTAFSAMEDYAMETKNGALARDLANSPIATEISVSGQTLRLAAERTPDSATAKIQEVMKERQKAVEDKMGTKNEAKIKSEIKKSLIDKIAKTKTTKYNWTAFLDEIKC